MTNCFTRTEKQEEKTNEEIQETFFSIREQKIKKDAAGNGYLSDETIANRASDALLNYMEACYEKNGNLDAKAIGELFANVLIPIQIIIRQSLLLL